VLLDQKANGETLVYKVLLDPQVLLFLWINPQLVKLNRDQKERRATKVTLET